MSAVATPRRRPVGSRPPPTATSSSSRSAVASPVPSGSDNQLFVTQLEYPVGGLAGAASPLGSSAHLSNSRAVTPTQRPVLSSLHTSGGIAYGIGKLDLGDDDEPVNPPVLPPLRPAGPPLSLSFGQDNNSSRPSLRPPPIGGGSRRGPKIGLAIPLGSSPVGAIGKDDEEAVRMLETDNRTNGNPSPLMSGVEEGDITVRPPVPQHTQRDSVANLSNIIPSLNSGNVSGGDDWAEAEQYLEDVKRLGEGAGGEVYLVKDTRTDKILARKIIQARTTPPKQLVRELKYLNHTNHPNIIRFYGAYISPSSSEVKVVMEYCEGGSLEAIGERISGLGGRVSEKVAGKIAEGIFNGLAYLHSLKIIHRDIKPSNILLSRMGLIKLCDFGVSGELVDSVASTWTGTSMYMAPERITGGMYTIRSDVWSSGLTLLTLAQNRFPYPDDLTGIVELITYISSEEIPQLTDEEPDATGHGGVHWSQPMKEFISICLTRDGETRPTPSEVLRHPWLLDMTRHKVNMAQWIRDVWEWEKSEQRGRPSTGLSTNDGYERSRRPSAVRADSRTLNVQEA